MCERRSPEQSAGHLSLFTSCLWALFVIQIYGAGSTALGYRVYGHSFIISLGPPAIYCVMILLGFAELSYQNRLGILSRHHIRAFLLSYLFVLGLMLAQLPLNDSRSTPLVIWEDLLVWLMPSVAVFGMKRANWQVLMRVFLWHTILGLAGALVIVPVTLGDSLLIESLGRGMRTMSALGVLAGLLYASPFLLLSWSIQSAWARIVPALGVALTTWGGIMGQFRNRLVTGVLVVLLAGWWIPWRLREKGRRPGLTWVLIRLAAGAILLSALFTDVSGLASYGRTGTAFLRQVEAMQLREQQGDYGVQAALLDRLQESQEALAEGSVWQLIVGQGVASTWSGGTLYLERRGMLHLGFGHLMFRGGILLLVLVMVFPFGVGIHVFLRSRDPLVLACASLLFLRVVFLFVANQFALSLAYVLTFLCAGGCLIHWSDSPRLKSRGGAA